MATYNFTDGGKIYKDDVLHVNTTGPTTLTPRILYPGSFTLSYGSYTEVYDYVNNTYEINGVAFAGTLAAFCTAAGLVIADGDSDDEASGAAAYSTVTTTLTNTQIKALFQTPVQIMDAPESGKLNIVVSIAVVANFSVAYNALEAGNEDYLNFRYGQTEPNDADIAYIANGEQPTLNTFLTNTGERVTILPVLNQRNDASWSIVSKTVSWPIAFFEAGLWIGGGYDAAGITGGNAANTMKVIVGYYTVDA